MIIIGEAVEPAPLITSDIVAQRHDRLLPALIFEEPRWVSSEPFQHADLPHTAERLQH
jgi:hypothetical protein